MVPNRNLVSVSLSKKLKSRVLNSGKAENNESVTFEYSGKYLTVSDNLNCRLQTRENICISVVDCRIFNCLKSDNIEFGIIIVIRKYF
jgi:hypothetical protein